MTGKKDVVMTVKEWLKPEEGVVECGADCVSVSGTPDST